MAAGWGIHHAVHQVVDVGGVWGQLGTWWVSWALEAQTSENGCLPGHHIGLVV